MPWFRVTAPITGEIEIDVEADSEEEAIQKAESSYNIECVTEWTEDISAAKVEEVFEIPPA